MRISGMIVVLKRFVCFLAFVCATSHPAWCSTYGYDRQGRLNSVTDSSGHVAEYVYDSVGNLLRVVRRGSADLSVISFSPTMGPPGTPVAIMGSGFSSIASENTVSFNGVVASVSSASNTSVVVIVPWGASSGPISVAVAGLTAQSTENFEVTPDDGSPVITDFSPKCAAPGQVVTVAGLNFDPRPNATRIEIGDQIASSVATSSTSLSFRAPRRTVGGRVRAITSRGIGESLEALAVESSTLTCVSNWQETRWVTVDGPAESISLEPNKNVALLFRANVGDWISVQATEMNPAGNFFSVTFLGSDGNPLDSAQFGPNRAYSLHAPVIRVGGTYSVRIKASEATAVRIGLESPALLRPGMSARHEQILARHSRRVAFDVHPDSELGVGINPVEFAAQGVNGSISGLSAPDGSTIAGWNGSGGTCFSPVGNANCHIIVPSPLSAGRYAFTAWANGAVASDWTFWLSDDIGRTLLPGQSQEIELDRDGQNARLRFLGEAGTGVSVDVANLQMSLGNLATVDVFDPNNQLLTQSSGAVSEDRLSTGGGMISIPYLSESGLYTVVVSPNTGGPSSFEATLDPGTPVEIDGDPVYFETNRPRKGVRVVIDAEVGDKFGLGILGLDFDAGSAAGIDAVVYAPDGSRYSSFSCGQPVTPAVGCEIDFGPMPMSGRYAIAVHPSASAPGFHFTIQATRDLEVDPEGGSIQRYGGNARLSFVGVPGQGQTIHVDNYHSDPSGSRSWITVLRPDGVPINSPLYGRLDISSGNGVIKIGDFPMEGVYTAFFDPFHAARASWIGSIESGVDVSVGQVSTHKSVEPGPWARTSFTAQVGQHVSVGLDINSLSNPTGSYVRLTVFDPNGFAIPQRDSTTTYSQCSRTTGGCDFDTPILALAGQYQVWAELPVASPDDASVQLSVNSDLVATGTSASFNLDARGQNGQLIFAGTTGQRPKITVTRTSQTDSGREVVIDVLGPDGARITGTTMSSSQTIRSFTLGALAQGGDHVVYIDPANGFQTAVNVTVE